jgi:hypothetical protein
LEQAQLANYAVAIAAGDDSKLVEGTEMLEHAAGSRH